MLLKSPPATTLPSVWSAMSRTKLFASGFHESANPVAVEPGDAIASLPADAVRSVEIAADQNLAIRLQPDDADRAVRVRVEGIRQSAGGIEPGDAAARLTADGGETASR